MGLGGPKRIKRPFAHSWQHFTCARRLARLSVASMFVRSTLIGVAACMLMLVSACRKEEQSKTTMPTAWRSPTYEGGPFNKLFVVGIGKDDARRRLYEDSVVAALGAEGATAEASWKTFPDSEDLIKQKILEVTKNGGFDAVLITRLVGIDEKTKYVPGESHLTEVSDPDLYLTNTYELVNTPGYYETTTTFRVETALYAVEREERVWSGLSETVDPESVEEVIESVSAIVAKRIKSEGFVP